MIPHRLDDPYDQALIAQVRPVTWENPKPKSKYDLVVIGAGAAGLVCAVGAAGLGAQVAIVERHYLGGDCLNFGCVPSKAIIGLAQRAHTIRTAEKYGFDVSLNTVNYLEAIRCVRLMRSTLAPNDSVDKLKQAGVDTFFGEARFESMRCIRVGPALLNFRKAVIASGTRPAIPNLPGLSEIDYLTNETLFQLNDLPYRIAVLGAGPIGCELAQAYARLGAQVTLFTNGHRFLPKEEDIATSILLSQFEKEKIIVHYESIERVLPGQVILNDCEIPFDRLLVATGRTTDLSPLQLPNANVATNAHGLVLNCRLQTTNRHVYAAGDIASETRFTHAADEMARIVLRNALFKGRARFDPHAIPRCTFTDPEIASIGSSEFNLNREGQTFDSYLIPGQEIDRAVVDGRTPGFIKILTRKGSDRILGATIVGPRAGEMIGTLSFAMTNGLGLKALSASIFPYPTYTAGLKKIGDQFNRSRLTKFNRWLLKRLMKL